MWKEWDAGDWGRALLNHYFEGHNTGPVSRLAISPDELARAAAAPDNEAQTARDAFVRAVRRSPAEFRRELSSANLNPSVWNRREPPPFLAYLFFTCFAAASLDADIVDVGVFRERIAQLLDHEPHTSYPLSDLPQLWEAFADWLREQPKDRKPYRALILPDPGRMVRIGYSVRLAFPRRDDRLRLRDVLSVAQLGLNPTVPEAFQAIGRTRDRFSADFRHVFDRARKALGRGADVPDLQALWSAILEATALPAKTPVRERGVQFQLLSHEDELGRIDPVLVASGTTSGAKQGARFIPLDEPFGHFKYFISAKDGNTELIVKLLLIQGLEDKVADLQRSPLLRAVRDGVLLFRRADSATWELVVTRPPEGRMRALVRDSLFASFIRLLTGPSHKSQQSQFEGWRQVADFDITAVADPLHAAVPEMAGVRCLQRVEIGPQLHFVGGIRLAGGFLGTQGLLPEVHCEEAECVGVFRLTEENGASQSSLIATLRRADERTGVFSWEAEQSDLEGAHVLVGTRNGKIAVLREVVFHSRGLIHAYARPTDPSRWLVEMSTSDMAPAGQGVDAFLADVPFNRGEQLPARNANTRNGVQVLVGRSVDDDARHDRFAEAAAAISVGRKGIAEGDLIEVLAATIPEAQGFIAWSVLRGWTEAGFFDVLTRRQWRGRVYFARQPRLVAVPDDRRDSARIVLHGLSPFRLRETAREVFARAGAELLPAASLSTFVPAPLAWRVSSVQRAEAIADKLGLLSLSYVRTPGELAGTVDAVVTDESPLPPGYELQHVWDWVAAAFRRPRRAAMLGQVRIEYHTRMNGPDRYLVVDADGRARTTLSRSWALLDGFRRAGKRAFDAAADGATIVRRSGDGPQVPLPLARALALRSGIVAGPTGGGPNAHQYAYAAAQSREQRWLVAWLNGTRNDKDGARRLAWLLAAGSARSNVSVPIPADLRRRLRELHHLPDALSMSDRRIQRRLLPHLRYAVDLAED